MDKSQLERLAPLTGVLSVAAMIAGAVIFGFYSYLPSADELAQYFTDNATKVALGGYVGSLAGFFLIWFAGSLRSTLRAHDDGDGRLAELAFGGGIGSGVAMAVGYTLIATAGQRAGATGGISPAGAATLYDLATTIQGNVFGLAVAVMLIATALASLRSAVFPTWFGWLSAVIAVVLLTPIAYIALYAVPVWLLVVSVWLYMRGA